MSTEILSTMTKTPLEIEAYSETQVGLILGEGAGSYLRKEFIAAVETELNGIFISRDDLPEVVKEESGWNLFVDGQLYSSSFQAHRELAFRHLAAVEYLKKNPPVDQKQVEALAQILADKENWPVHDRHKDVARTILASGKVTFND